MLLLKLGAHSVNNLFGSITGMNSPLDMVSGSVVAVSRWSSKCDSQGEVSDLIIVQMWWSGSGGCVIEMYVIERNQQGDIGVRE